MAEFLMPTLGADMDFGTLLEWRVKPGDTVKRGDIVAVVDTSKAEIEVEIFQDGVIDELLVSEGTRVPVGTTLATVRAPAESATPAAPAGAKAPPAAKPPAAPKPPSAPPPPQATVSAPAPAPPAPAAPPRAAHRLRASPVARRAAQQLGVDLERIAGSGPEGAITKADVEQAASGAGAPAQGGAPAARAETAGAPAEAAPLAPPTPAPQAAERGERQAAMREAIAALMARSKREIPHYYLQSEIDLTSALSWLGQENLKRPVPARLLPSALLLRAVAGALAATPQMNGFFIDGSFREAEHVHLGVAIALRGGGLIAPALHNADKMSLDELMAGLRDLVGRARTGRLRASEMSDPTITVTNLGEQAVDLVHGVIYPPQVALVGFGGIRERPWAAHGMIGPRPVVVATLAADHRTSDGHTGSRFLSLINRRLQKPEEL